MHRANSSHLESIYGLRLKLGVGLIKDEALLQAGVEVGDEGLLLGKRQRHNLLPLLSLILSFLCGSRPFFLPQELYYLFGCIIPPLFAFAF